MCMMTHTHLLGVLFEKGPSFSRDQCITIGRAVTKVTHSHLPLMTYLSRMFVTDMLQVPNSQVSLQANQLNFSFFLSFSLNVCYKYTKSITKTVALDNFAYNNNSSNILKHYGSTREPSCRVDDIKGRWWWQKIIRVCKDVWNHNEAGNSLMFVVQLRSQQIIFFYKINILC